jgi:hypothetical protein
MLLPFLDNHLFVEFARLAATAPTSRPLLIDKIFLVDLGRAGSALGPRWSHIDIIWWHRSLRRSHIDLLSWSSRHHFISPSRPFKALFHKITPGPFPNMHSLHVLG